MRRPLEGAGRRPLGETILLAVEATGSRTRANTNLGIVLLLSPLARAAVLSLDSPPAPERDRRLRNLRSAVAGVLADTTIDGSDTATNGTQRALTESHVLEASQLAYDDGGNPSLMVCGSFNKRVISGFAGNQVRNTNASEKELINSITVYEDDFNTLKVVSDRFALSRNVLLLDTEYAKIAYLRDFDTWDLAVTGSSIRKQVEVEWALEVCNRDAHAIIRDVTTS